MSIHSQSGMGSIAKDSNFANPTQISPFRTDLHSGMGEWATLPKDILVLIADNIDFFEDFFNFCIVCKSWQSVSSICKKSSRTLPPRCPWVMLTDIAEKNFPKVTWEIDDVPKMLIEEVAKNQHREGINKRRFFCFSTSKTYEFELPEATLRKCLGVSNGWLMTVGYDFQINLLHPFSRQQVGMPSLLSFQSLQELCEFSERKQPQERISDFIHKAIMSCNPYDSDCMILAIYGDYCILAFARPGQDNIWTDIYPRYKNYRDAIYYKGKFYAITDAGVVVVCDIHNVKGGPTTTPIACIPKSMHCSDFRWKSKYLVESSEGSLLVVVRLRKGLHYNEVRRIHGIVDVFHLEDDVDYELNYTVGFSIFKMEECVTGGDDDRSIVYDPKDNRYDRYQFPFNLRPHRRNEGAYPYKLIPVNNLGDNALFLGHNVSVSLPASSDNNVKANQIYFSEDETDDYWRQPYGGGRDTGIYDVETGKITWHYASKFISRLTPPLWYI